MYPRFETDLKYIKLDEELQIGELVSVKARLDLKHSTEKTVVYGMRNVKVINNAYLYDAYGSQEFTIWDEWITYFKGELEVGNDCFLFRNILVKEFNASLSLSTCSESECNVLKNESIPVPNINDNASPEILIKEFDAVQNITYQYICNNC